MTHVGLEVQQRTISDGDVTRNGVDLKTPTGVIGQIEGVTGKDFRSVPFDHIGKGRCRKIRVTPLAGGVFESRVIFVGSINESGWFVRPPVCVGSRLSSAAQISVTIKEQVTVVLDSVLIPVPSTFSVLIRSSNPNIFWCRKCLG